MLRPAFIVAVVAGLVGCVNNYVVRDPEDDGSTSGCPMDDCGQGDTATADGPGTFECIPCESDLECGDEWDNCVALDVIGLHCLFACPEAGCPEGRVCRPVLSVDEVEAMQCVPRAPSCADATED